MSSAAAAVTVLDPRAMGRPRSWDVKFRHFNVSMKGFVGALSPLLLKIMKIAETVDREIDPVYYEFDDTQVALNAGLFYVLTNTTEGDAADIVDGVEEGWGLEAWRLMTKPFR